jgi:hypothetical protein
MPCPSASPRNYDKGLIGCFDRLDGLDPKTPNEVPTRFARRKGLVYHMLRAEDKIRWKLIAKYWPSTAGGPQVAEDSRWWR